MKRRFSAIVVIPLILLAASCNDDQLRRAAKADLAIAESINAAIKITTQLSSEGKLSKSEETAIIRSIFVLHQANIVFHEQVKRTQKLDPSSKQSLTLAFKDMLKAAANLNNEGLLVQDPDAKRNYNLIFSGLQASIEIINGVLQ